ncbi:hypothetical protein ACQ4PT_062124 [Festuca glaucescens]
METDGQLDDFYKHHQFKPSKEDAVTYFLPRLLAGSPLPHGADSLIRHADVYACEPKDLAAQFAPVPSATTDNVYHEGVKVGEVKHLSFKKGRTTGWVMKEYRCLLPQAVVADGEKVLCKIHLVQHAPAAARQESDAYKLRQQRAEPAPAQQSHKRPTPVAAAADPPCSKKMRMAAPVPEPECPVWVTPAASAHVHKMWTPARVPVPAPVEMEFEDCPVWLTSAAPVSLPAASTEVPHAPEADGDTGRMSCTMEELLGPQQQQEQTQQTLPVEAEDFDWESLDRESEHLLLRPWDDDWESAAQEEQTPPVEAENNIEQIDTHQPDTLQGYGRKLT